MFGFHLPDFSSQLLFVFFQLIKTFSLNFSGRMNMELSFLVDGEVYKARQLFRKKIIIAKSRTVGHHGEGEDLLY